MTVSTVPPPAAVRRLGDAWLGGVCAGLSKHFGWPVLVLRVAFVILAASRLVGVAVYALAWLLLPTGPATPQAPGIEAADRTGMRSEPAAIRATDVGTIVAVVLLGGGLIWLVQALGWGLDDALLWPLLVGGVGMALIWWQADHISARSLRGPKGRIRVLAPLVAHWTTVLALLAGVVLGGVAIWLAMRLLPSGVGEVTRTLAILGLVLVGLLAAAAPWLIRVRRELHRSREERLLTDAHADMAAHLHDSVLQTLALIQRQASDPKAVARLARSQERELRTWLYGEPRSSETLKAALTATAAEVEDDHGVDVELVVVGDAPMTPALDALVRAAGEAVVNAAKHAGVSLVDVYAEVLDTKIEVFIRDRGKGFDPANVPADRQGLTSSVTGRMERHGGSATIRSRENEGTEVRLEMGR